jgi:hypothetical protein
VLLKIWRHKYCRDEKEYPFRWEFLRELLNTLMNLGIFGIPIDGDQGCYYFFVQLFMG